MKLEPFVYREYQQGIPVKVRRCQGINISDYRRGQQCANIIDPDEDYCYAHRKKDKKGTVHERLVEIEKRVAAIEEELGIGGDIPEDLKNLSPKMLRFLRARKRARDAGIDPDRGRPIG